MPGERIIQLPLHGVSTIGQFYTALHSPASSVPRCSLMPVWSGLCFAAAILTPLAREPFCEAGIVVEQ